jgi:hypothetical protein
LLLLSDYETIQGFVNPDVKHTDVKRQVRSSQAGANHRPACPPHLTPALPLNLVAADVRRLKLFAKVDVWA